MSQPQPRSPDPSALIDLLWAPDAAVNRHGLTGSEVVAAAVELADQDGWAAVSMRRLAHRMGIPAMTLYGIVPSRADLLELMIDRVNGEVHRGQATPADAGDWAHGLRRIGHRGYRCTMQHPWLQQAPPARPVLGPGVCQRYELELAALDGHGFSDLEMDHTLSAVHSLAAQLARWQVGLTQARDVSGLSDDQWWAQQGPRLARHFATLDLAVSTRVGASVASAGRPGQTLDFALDTLIAGLSSLLADRSGSP